MYVQSAINGAQVWYASNENSKRLAELLQASLKEKLEQNNNRVAKDSKDDYRILRDGFDGASVIVECGFLSNPTESELLKDEKYQDKIVSALVKGIKSYYKE
ncbi:Germination-specific N-acetylmuramoyl-L-alanine amidase precursor [compost metagenome]